jgi:hypothetical protein
MTPKQKAEQLLEAMAFSCRECDYEAKAKQCALIAVDEILQSLGHKKLGDSPYTTLEARQYYVQVKQELEAL